MKNVYKKVAVQLSEELETKPYIDVSKGTEINYAVTKEIFRKAIFELQDQNDRYILTFIKVAPNVIRKFLSKEELTFDQIQEIKRNFNNAQT